jgi:transcriptional regulator with XRE-family HTH domain
MFISGSQIRAARGLLDWSVTELGGKVGVGATTISAIERGRIAGSKDVLTRIVLAFQSGGVELTDDGGVRPKKSVITTYSGANGFKDWFDDIYISVASSKNPDVCVANGDEEKFEYWLGDFEPIHMARIAALNLPKYKVLLRSDDTLMRSSAYSEFRWMKTNQFAYVCVYLYANKCAFVEFQSDHVAVTVVDNSFITNAQRRIFNAVWEDALKDPPQQ